ncbi:MAG: hypothetical protein GVY07_09785 [Bacteroidetes bacterium]|jgi:hypothetical protein|nr:hypothetical protein [Bacteroidota bacterium]
MPMTFFLGSLVLVGFFLSAYNGTGGEIDWEFYLSKISCVFVIYDALFPTQGFTGSDIPPAWTTTVANAFNLEPMNIHYGAAIPLFTCLIVMMWFFSKRAMKKGKTGRSYRYRSISVLMVFGILSIFIYGRETEMENMVLWIEIWGLTLFGIGWLIAGSYKTDPSLNEA